MQSRSMTILFNYTWLSSTFVSTIMPLGNLSLICVTRANLTQFLRRYVISKQNASHLYTFTVYAVSYTALEVYRRLASE